MPSKAVVRQAQRNVLATDGTEVQSFESAVGLAVLDDEGLFRIHARGRHVLWIPNSDKQLQVRLMICAHMRDCLLYTSPSPRDKRQSRMPSSA